MACGLMQHAMEMESRAGARSFSREFMSGVLEDSIKRHLALFASLEGLAFFSSFLVHLTE